MAISKVKALRDFFLASPNSSKLGMAEIKAFKEACTDAEWADLTEQAARAIGETTIGA